MRTTFENVASRPSAANERDMLEMFQDLCRKWYPDPALNEGAINLTERYSAFVRRIAEDPDLAFLDNQLFRGMPTVAQPEVTPRKAVYFCMEMIQLMEDVYFELNLQHRSVRENPIFAGWLDVFEICEQSACSPPESGGQRIQSDFPEYFEGLMKTAD